MCRNSPAGESVSKEEYRGIRDGKHTCMVKNRDCTSRRTQYSSELLDDLRDMVVVFAIA
jgi:hypothetical protein